MILRSLFCYTSLMFLQRCQAQYNNFGNHLPNQIRKVTISSIESSNSDDNYYSREILCNHRKKSCSESDEDCECSCDQCLDPKPCCRRFCKKCKKKTTYDNYTPVQNIIRYHTLPQPKLMYVHYAVPQMPVMLYTLQHQKIPYDNQQAEKTAQTQKSDSVITFETIQVFPETTEPAPKSSKDDKKSTTKQSVNISYKTRTTRKLEPELERLTKSVKNTTQKAKQNSYKYKTRRTATTQTIPTKPNTKRSQDPLKNNPSTSQQPIPTVEEQNISEYFDYPDENIKKKITDTRCKDAANCYSRNWNKKGQPVKLYIETNSSLMPLVRLRPTLGRLKRRTMPPTPKYKLKALNDNFVRKLMKELKNKQVLVLQNNNE